MKQPFVSPSLTPSHSFPLNETSMGSHLSVLCGTPPAPDSSSVDAQSTTKGRLRESAGVGTGRRPRSGGPLEPLQVLSREHSTLANPIPGSDPAAGQNEGEDRSRSTTEPLPKVSKSGPVPSGSHQRLPLTTGVSVKSTSPTWESVLPSLQTVINVITEALGRLSADGPKAVTSSLAEALKAAKVRVIGFKAWSPLTFTEKLPQGSMSHNSSIQIISELQRIGDILQSFETMRNPLPLRDCANDLAKLVFVVRISFQPNLMHF